MTAQNRPSEITDGSSWAEVFTPEETYDALQGYVAAGAIQYVLPTDPLGEEWVLGLAESGLIKLTQEQAACWLAGAGAVTRLLALRGVKPA